EKTAWWRGGRWARGRANKNKKRGRGGGQKGEAKGAGDAGDPGSTRAPPLGSTASHRRWPTPATSASSRSSAPDRVPAAAPCRGDRRRSAPDEDCCRAR